MADNDLFAPPTEDELFGAPTEAELGGVPTSDEPQQDANGDFIFPNEEYEFVGGEPLPTSKTEAFVQHAAPSATLGLSDVVSGAAGAAGHAYGSLTDKGELPSKQELLDTYYEAKGDTAQKRAEAMEDQPIASIAGMVGGGFMTPLPGAVLSKGGKAAQGISKLLPSLKGADKISKAGKLAEKAKLVGNLDKYKKLKSIQGAAALKLAAKEGGKAGAAMGATMGESKLLEGDTEGFIKDTLGGGALGAATSAGFTAGTQVTGKLVNKLPFIQNALDSFKFGSKGVDLNEAEVNHSINKAATKYLKMFDDKLNKLKIDKEDVLNTMDELGITINTKDDLLEAKRKINAIESESHRNKARQFLDVLDDYLGEGKAYKKIKENLDKKIIKTRYSDPVAVAKTKLEKRQLKEAIEDRKVPTSSDDLGVISSHDILPGDGPDVKAQVKHNIFEKMTKDGPVQRHQMKAEIIPEFRPSKIQRSVDSDSGRDIARFKDFASGKVHTMVGEQSRALNAKKLSVDQATKLKELMNEYSFLAKKENLPNEIKKAATEAAKMINEKINGAADEIATPIRKINKDISNLLTAKKRIGLDKTITDFDKESAQKSMAKFIAGIGDKNPISDKNLVLQRLRKVDPKMADEITQELNDLRRQYELSAKQQGSANTTNFLHAIWGSVNSVWNKAFNTLGQASTAPFKVASSASKGVKSSLANKSLNIVEASPAQIQGVINKIQEGGNKASSLYLEPLKKAMKSKPRTKQAILYGLYQQPAFRELVDMMTEQEPEE